MGLNTQAGGSFALGPQNAAADDEAAYEALSFTEVGNIEDFGNLLKHFNVSTFNAADKRRVTGVKGARDDGSITIVVGYDAADTGLAGLDAAFASDNTYAVRFTLGDEPEGSPSNPTTVWFRALITDIELQMGGAENVVRKRVTMRVESDYVEKAAA